MTELENLHYGQMVNLQTIWWSLNIIVRADGLILYLFEFNMHKLWSNSNQVTKLKKIFTHSFPS